MEQLEQRKREVLQKNRMYLSKNIGETTMTEVVNFLQWRGVLTEDDKELILAEKNTSLKVFELLDMLERSGPNAFDAFVQALNSSGCGFVARRLQSELAGESPDIDPQQKATCLGLCEENPKIIGRGEDCEKITQTLTLGARILLIVGPPGFGKTAVAIAVGHMMKGQGKDIVYISLRTVTSVEAAAKKMLEVVGIPLARAPILQVQQYLTSLLKHTVLILDNAEDLQKEDGALFDTFLDAISKEATNVLTLVTSRILLSKLDYHITPVEYPLKPLTEEQSVVFLQNEGIPDQWATLFSRHKVCGGVPLLLKITASFLLKSKTIDPVELHRSLHECKDEFLRGKNPEIQELHRRLEVFYNYLPSDVRKALSYLATFPTVFKKGEAKEVLFKEMKPLDFDFILSALESHSLVEPEEVDGCLQYSLHPLVQAFCVTTRGSLCGNEYNMAINLFSQHHLRLLEQLNDDFISTDCKPAIDKYQLNKTNICHALNASKDGHLKHFGLHISTKTVNFLAKCMNINEFTSIYGNLLNVVKTLPDKRLYSECQFSIGFKQLCFHGYKEAHRTNAITNLQEAHELQKSLGINDECRGQCECKLGLCTFVAGDKKKGISLIARGIGRRKTLAQSRDAGKKEQMLVGAGYSDLAMAMYDSQKYKAAVNIWKNISLVRYRRLLGTHPFTASVLDYLGNAYQKLGCAQEAVRCKKECLQMRCSLLGEDHLDTARAYYGLGCALEVLGSTEEALKNLSKAYRVQTRFHASPQDIKKTKRELDRLQEVVRLQKDRMPNHVAAIEELLVNCHVVPSLK
ncbi:uncharacterized protein [Montipora capricornis]|uniref:uncharacterized protein n=1 Tax=Montipora capricornis TaxID=246305 RepID=UPI0035F200CB